MTLDQLRAFVALAEERTFARAAMRLHVTQPALTKRIKALELAWGGMLFDRSGVGSRLTTLGEALLADAVLLLDAADAFGRRARDAVRGERGRLDIGFGLSAIDFAPRIVAAFRARHPHVAMSLNDFSSKDQADRLLSGRLDIGFVRLPTSDGLMSFPVLEERLALAAPGGWPGFDGNGGCLDARGFVMLAQHRGSGLSEQVMGWCAENGVMPRVVQTADDIQTVFALVAVEVGYGLVPERAGRLAGGKIRILPLPGDAARWRVGAAWRRGNGSPVLANFLAVLRDDMAMTASPATPVMD